MVIIVVYVDDLIIASNNNKLRLLVKRQIMETFKTRDLGNLKLPAWNAHHQNYDLYQVRSGCVRDQDPAPVQHGKLQTTDFTNGSRARL
jgi:hypothetical protein